MPSCALRPSFTVSILRLFFPILLLTFARRGATQPSSIKLPDELLPTNSYTFSPFFSLIFWHTGGAITEERSRNVSARAGGRVEAWFYCGSEERCKWVYFQLIPSKKVARVWKRERRLGGSLQRSRETVKNTQGESTR